MKHFSMMLLLLAAGCGQYGQVFYATPPEAGQEGPVNGAYASTPQTGPVTPTYNAYSTSPPPGPVTPTYNAYSASPPPGIETTAYGAQPGAPDTPFYPGGRFGYAGVFFGVGGMPGRNDIQPGFSWTVVVPPGGVIVTAVSSALLVGGLLFDAAAYASGYDGEPMGTYMALGGLSEVLPFTEDMCYQGQSVAPPGGTLTLEGVSLDLYITGSRNRDLTNSADVLTYGGGLNASFIAGLGRGGRARLLLGYEYRKVDFKARADGDNHGPMIGAALEFSAGGHVAFTTQFRYVFTFGTASDYDFWDVSMGTALYW